MRAKEEGSVAVKRRSESLLEGMVGPGLNFFDNSVLVFPLVYLNLTAKFISCRK